MHDLPPIRRVSRSRTQAQPPANERQNTLGPGLGLGLGGGWFLIFSQWQPLPSWTTGIFAGAGFVLVLLGLLLFGIALGNLITWRRRHDF